MSGSYIYRVPKKLNHKKKYPTLNGEASDARIEELIRHGYDVKIVYKNGVRYVLKRKIDRKELF